MARHHATEEPQPNATRVDHWSPAWENEGWHHDTWSQQCYQAADQQSEVPPHQAEPLRSVEELKALGAPTHITSYQHYKVKHTAFHMADVERVKRQWGLETRPCLGSLHDGPRDQNGLQQLQGVHDLSCTQKAYDELNWRSTPRDLVQWCRRHMEQPIEEGEAAMYS